MFFSMELAIFLDWYYSGHSILLEEKNLNTRKPESCENVVLPSHVLTVEAGYKEITRQTEL